MSDLSNASREQLIKSVHSGLMKAGLSHAASLAMVGEIGRENSYRPDLLFGYHTDPHNKATNIGIISWQGSRAKELQKHLQDQGLIVDGKMARTQEAIDAQAQFMVNEMSTNPMYRQTHDYLTRENIDANEAMDVIGKNYIRWRIDDSKYRASGIKNRTDYYNLGANIIGSGESMNASTQGGLPPLPGDVGTPSWLPTVLPGTQSNADPSSLLPMVSEDHEDYAVPSDSMRDNSLAKYNFNSIDVKVNPEDVSGSFRQLMDLRVEEANQKFQKQQAARYILTQTPEVPNYSDIRKSGQTTYLTRSEQAQIDDSYMRRKAMDEAFGDGFGGLFNAHFADSRDRFNTSIGGSAYRVVRDEGFNPTHLVNPVAGVVNTLVNAARSNNASIGDIISGRMTFERPDADYSTEEREAAVSRFKKSYGVDMDEDYKNKIMSSTRREDTSRIYGAAARNLEISHRMAKSGMLANFAAGVLTGMASPEEAPANLFGGAVVRGAKGIATSARIARRAEKSRLARGIQEASAAMNATNMRRNISEGVISGAASAAGQNIYRTDYTIADALGDVVIGGTAAGGLTAAGRVVRSGLFGKGDVEDFGLSKRVADSLDESSDRVHRYAIDARAQMEDIADARGDVTLDAAQAEVINGPLRNLQKEVNPRTQIMDTSSPELMADLEKASSYSQNFRFTRELTRQERKALEGTQLVEERVEQRAARTAEVESEKLQTRIKSAEQNLETASQHLDSRRKAHADVYTRLQNAQKNMDQPSDADVSRIMKAENRLDETTTRIENLGKQANEIEANIRARMDEVDNLRATTPNARAIDRAANAVAREQDKLNTVNNKISTELEKARVIRQEVDQLNNSPRDAVASTNRNVREANKELERLAAQVSRASDIYNQRKSELETLQGLNPRTADDIAGEIRAKGEPVKRSLTLEDIETIEGSLEALTVKDMARELGVEEYLRGNNLAHAIRVKHGMESSSATKAKMDQDARVAEVSERSKKVNKAMNNSILSQVVDSGTVLSDSKSDATVNFGRSVAENSSGAYGGATASLRALTNSESIMGPIMSSHQSSLSEMATAKGVSALAVARSKDFRRSFAMQERDMLDMLLRGAVTPEKLAKDFPDMPEFIRHVTNLYDGLNKLNQLEWQSKGNVGKAPPITQMPVRWNHGALGNLAQTPQGVENMRQALIKSVKDRRDERLRDTPDMDAMTDPEIDMWVDDYMKAIFRTADGSAFGSVSLHNREFNLWKSTEEMVSTGRVELDAMRTGGYKKLEALYDRDRTVDKDLTIKFDDGTGKTISLDDLTNPSQTDAMNKLVKYRSGVIALREVGYDIEDPKARAVFEDVINRQGATRQEKDHIESIIATMVGRPYKNKYPNKALEILGSATRANMLGGLVWAQAAEFANILAHVGVVGGARILSNGLRHHRVARNRAKGRMVGEDAVSDFEKHAGYMGDHGFRPSSIFDPAENNGFVDSMDLDGEKLFDRILKTTRNLEQFQSVITLFSSLNAIMKRGVTEEYVLRTARVVRDIKAGKQIEVPRELISAGIDERRLRDLAKQDGVFLWDGDRFRGTDLERINDPILAADIITGIRRGAGQAVQETFAGEAGLYSHSPFGRFFMMFRGYTATSISKQMVRQYGDFGPARFATSALVGATWAGSVMYAKAWVRAQTMDPDKREAYLEEQANGKKIFQNAIMYHSSLGVGHEALNLVGATTGLFETGTRTGSPSLEGALPTVAMANNLIQSASGVGKSITQMATGEKPDAKYVREAASSLPLRNSIYFQATLGRMIERYAEDERDDNDRQRKMVNYGWAPRTNRDGEIVNRNSY